MAEGKPDLKTALGQYGKNNKLTSTECSRMAKSCLKGYCGIKDDKLSNITDIAFSKVVQKGQRAIDINDPTIDKYCNLIDEEMKKLKLDSSPDAIKQKLLEGKKQTTAVTKTVKAGGVDRLTDTSKYTGAHKERFNADGTGRGAAGREDKADNTGYVGNYKGAGTYDKK